MNNICQHIRTSVLIFITIFLSACATVEKAPTERYFWPPPPDVARIEWIKSYNSQLDIEKSSSQLFWTAISGDDKPITLAKPLEVKSVPELQRFYVSDVGRAAVIVFDRANHGIRNLETPPGAPAIRHPLSMGYDDKFNLYLLERRSNTIIVFDKNEKYQRHIMLSGMPGVRPIAMALDKKLGRIFLADGGSRKIVVLDLQGQFLFNIGKRGDDDGQFNMPIGIAINSVGEIIVADAFNAAVHIFSGDGKFLRKFGRRGDNKGDFQLIKSVAVDSEDNIYVVDGRSHSISIFSREGDLLMSLGGYYAVASSGKLAPGGFSVPVGIDIDSNDRIYVVDQLNSRVQVFQYISQNKLVK
jgi:DNA-binding beta-propeller fold protein YncE